jgi:hypothetical protein
MKMVRQIKRPLIRYAGSAAETSIGPAPKGTELERHFMQHRRFVKEFFTDFWGFEREVCG